MLITNKEIGMIIHMEVQYKMTITLHSKKKKNTMKLPNKTVIVESTEFRSFESLLRIRPRGTLSKNSLREENRRLDIIDSWITADIFGLEIEMIMALKNANKP